jgi:hypothetical protein
MPAGGGAWLGGAAAAGRGGAPVDRAGSAGDVCSGCGCGRAGAVAAAGTGALGARPCAAAIGERFDCPTRVHAKDRSATLRDGRATAAAECVAVMTGVSGRAAVRVGAAATVASPSRTGAARVGVGVVAAGTGLAALGRASGCTTAGARSAAGAAGAVGAAAGAEGGAATCSSVSRAGAGGSARGAAGAGADTLSAADRSG